MRSQAFSDPSKSSYMQSPKTMEINPRHPIIAELNRALTAADGEPDESIQDTAWLLYDTALLQSGFAQDDVDSFAARMYRTMKGALSLDSLEVQTCSSLFAPNLLACNC